MLLPPLGAAPPMAIAMDCREDRAGDAGTSAALPAATADAVVETCQKQLDKHEQRSPEPHRRSRGRSKVGRNLELHGSCECDRYEGMMLYLRGVVHN